MKKYIVLFSSLFLVGTASLIGSQDAEANTNDIAEVKPLTSKPRADLRALDFSEDGVYYVVDESAVGKEVTITNHITNKLPINLVIPEKVTNNGVEYTVTKIDTGALGLGASEIDVLESVSIPKTVKSIGNSAFLNRGKLSVITLSEGLLTIGNNTFANNTSLRTINFPSTLTTIGDQTFKGASSLVSIDLSSSSVTAIGFRTFEDAVSLNSVKLPLGLTKLSSSLFLNCRALITLDIPNTVTLIESNAIFGSGITKIVLPTGINKLEGFGGQSLYSDVLEEITFTSPITGGLYSNVFKVPSKKGFTFAGWKNSSDGVTYEHDKLSSVATTGGSTVTAVWKADTTVPVTGNSDATIKLLEKQPVGSLTFGNVATDARIEFSDVTLDGKVKNPAEKSASKIVVNDSRTDKTKGWSVSVKYGNTNFLDKKMQLDFKPVSTTATVTPTVSLTTSDNQLFTSGTAKLGAYSVDLKPNLMIPADLSVTGEQKLSTEISWTLVADV